MLLSMRLAVVVAMILVGLRMDGPAALTADSSRPAVVVSAIGRIGPLRVDRSTSADISRYVGAPTFTGKGTPAANFRPFAPSFVALGYQCSRRWVDTRGINPGGVRATHVWCRTVYFLSARTGKLAGFWTDSPTFRTPNGSRPGMRQATADRLERSHAYAHALTGISLSGRDANLFIENAGCKLATPGGDPQRTPCLGGYVRSLIIEGRHPAGLLEDAFPNWNR
jgi:hypothetical protein